MTDTYLHALFYNSDSGDRKYDADSMSEWLKKFFTTGVFKDCYQVTANGDMTVAVSPGYSNIEGKVRIYQTSTSLTIATADATYDRIDAIVLERSDSDRDITLKVVTGALSTVPVAPTMVRADGVYQICLAQIAVGHGATSITQDKITDTRTDTTLCGYITGTVTEMDFSQFAAQFNAYYELFKSGNEADFEAWYAANKTAFNTWFEAIKGQLSTDAAGHLQNEIDALDLKMSKENRGFVAQVTTFPADGSIVITEAAGNKLTTTFPADGSIVDTYTGTDGTTVKMTHTTVFNADGSITETVA